ncbi:hypothetical protein OF83DRAFT_519369 [Amylostereum chailletii]|nr:hypothetical protein OF83DRAFT_519369 [Amylostereum chailletii]
MPAVVMCPSPSTGSYPWLSDHPLGPQHTRILIWWLTKSPAPLPRRLALPEPLPGTRTLDFQLGERLGTGHHTSVVHAVTPVLVTSPDNGSSESDQLRPEDIPQLVVKIGKSPNARDALNDEGWFYNHMEILQGSVIPLCFGYFEATIPNVKFTNAFDSNGIKINKAYDAVRRDSDRLLSLLILERLSQDRPPTGPNGCYNHGGRGDALLGRRDNSSTLLKFRILLSGVCFHYGRCYRVSKGA